MALDLPGQGAPGIPCAVVAGTAPRVTAGGGPPFHSTRWACPAPFLDHVAGRCECAIPGGFIIIDDVYRPDRPHISGNHPAGRCVGPVGGSCCGEHDDAGRCRRDNTDRLPRVDAGRGLRGGWLGRLARADIPRLARHLGRQLVGLRGHDDTLAGRADRGGAAHPDTAAGSGGDVRGVVSD